MASRYNRGITDQWHIFNSNYRRIKGEQVAYKLPNESPWYAHKRGFPSVTARDSFEEALAECMELEEIAANSTEPRPARVSDIYFRRARFHGEYSDVIPVWHKAYTVEDNVKFVAVCGYKRSNYLEDLVLTKSEKKARENLCYNCANNREYDYTHGR